MVLIEVRGRVPYHLCRFTVALVLVDTNISASAVCHVRCPVWFFVVLPIDAF